MVRLTTYLRAPISSSRAFTGNSRWTARPRLSNPWRLDLGWCWHKMARKGGVPKVRVLNWLNEEEFAQYLVNRCDQRRGKLRRLGATFLEHGPSEPKRRKLLPKAAR
jgi:hypothetical protein